MSANLPSLNSIKVFDAAARTGSFKKAAEELHVTPTAVSHQIKSLEESLGTQLFIRKTRAIELSNNGKLLAETAYRVLQQLTNTVNEISCVQNTITISTTSAFAAMWLAPNLNDFNQLHPEINIVVRTSERVDDLDKNRNVDLAIRYGVYDKSIANATLLITEKIGVYAAPNYLNNIALGQPINLLETTWQQQNTRLPEFRWQTLFQQQNQRKKPRKNQDRETILQFDQEHHIIQATLAGQGIALVSNLLVRNALKQGWLTQCNYLPDVNEVEGLSYYLRIPERNKHSNSIIAFSKWIIKKLSQY